MRARRQRLRGARGDDDGMRRRSPTRRRPPRRPPPTTTIPVVASTVPGATTTTDAPRRRPRSQTQPIEFYWIVDSTRRRAAACRSSRSPSRRSELLIFRLEQGPPVGRGERRARHQGAAKGSCSTSTSTVASRPSISTGRSSTQMPRTDPPLAIAQIVLTLTRGSRASARSLFTARRCPDRGAAPAQRRAQPSRRTGRVRGLRDPARRRARTRPRRPRSRRPSPNRPPPTDGPVDTSPELGPARQARRLSTRGARPGPGGAASPCRP